MKKSKKIITICIVVFMIVAMMVGYQYTKNWSLRYSSLLDDFFGQDNWACISEEDKDSLLLEKTIYGNDDIQPSKTVAASYRNWYIIYETENQTRNPCVITNHTYLLNHDSYGIFSGKRYSQKQALTLELMDISFDVISEEISTLLAQQSLSQEEVDCLDITMSYRGGNPSPGFYDDLRHQDWFHIQNITARDYLSYDQYDFYLLIRAFDYKVEKLSPELQQHLHNSKDAIVDFLLDTYGDDASFELYLGEEQRATYQHGTNTES